MKKKLLLLLSCTMALSLTACSAGTSAPASAEAPAAVPAGVADKDAQDGDAKAEEGGDLDVLVKTARAEGELTVYGSCEEEYLSAACQNFEKLYGIKTNRDFPPPRFILRFPRKRVSLLQTYGSAEPRTPTTKLLGTDC